MLKLRTALALTLTLLITGTATSGMTMHQDQKLRVVHQVAPVYPEEAKRLRVEGKVTLDVTVEQNGEVSMAKVVNGHQALQQAAVDAAKQWRFTNPFDNSVTIQLTMSFSLKPDSADATNPAPGAQTPLRNKHKVDAVYPEEAKRRGIQGVVAVEIKVSEDGQVTDARAVSGHEILRQSAVDAARQFRFENDRRAPVAATLTFNFVLK